MEQAIPERRIRIIKSVQSAGGQTSAEALCGEYPDDDQVLRAFCELEEQYAKNPVYEKLHGFNERLSLSFRNRDSNEIISFMTED
ncbi:hypothetical protein G5B00_09610 [Parapedobacter sp. SGR-10]|uniref:hypothetical protein n=1 Tax=Parapedobacter sp. SGR-10 TaxID=2710879 RepID=UPI0013D08C6B|nr:hypothetical protein [Parapedobacter sp. SGR-10]NGF56768.1 hypothetical protein [Parapedobacter sp. SGR-10]